MTNLARFVSDGFNTLHKRWLHSAIFSPLLGRERVRGAGRESFLNGLLELYTERRGPVTMKKSDRALGQAKPAPEVDLSFADVVKAFSKDPDVSLGKMFGSNGLRVNGKVFAMVAKGRFVAKLPKERVDELVASGDGQYFDPGHGRLMKEWVAFSVDKREWLKLAEEACRFVKTGGR